MVEEGASAAGLRPRMSLLFKKITRAVGEVKALAALARGLGFDSQHPRGDATTCFVMPVPKHVLPSSGLCRYFTRTGKAPYYTSHFKKKFKKLKPFHHMGLEDGTWVVRLGQKYLDTHTALTNMALFFRNMGQRWVWCGYAS